MKSVLPSAFALLIFLLSTTGCVGPTTKRINVSNDEVMAEAERQRETVIQNDHEMEERLMRVAYQLTTKGVALCGKQTSMWPGARAISRSMYSKDFAPAADRFYNLGADLKVRFVTPGGAAEVAGLRPGDKFVQIDGVPVPPDAGTPWLSKNYEVWRNKSEVAMVVQRDGGAQQIILKPELGCNYGVLLVEGDQVNAFADGRAIHVTRGMMRFAQTDTELALVVSHEFAHNYMRHIDAKRANQALGTLIDVLIAAGGINTGGAFGNSAAGAYSQEFESEADYAGLYMMALAGFDYREAPKFWRRMAIANPGGIYGSPGASHPSTAYRFKALEAAVSEIDLKKQARLELRPDLKPVADRRTAEDGNAPASGDTPGPGSKFKSRDFTNVKGTGPAPGDQTDLRN